MCAVKSWKDGKINFSNGPERLTFINGENILRIIDEIHEFVVHWDIPDKDGNLNRMFLCNGPNCVLCKAGNVSKNYYATLAISHASKQIGILDRAPIEVFQPLIAEAKDIELRDHLVNLICRRQGNRNKYEVHVSKKPAPLTQWEAELVAACAWDLEKTYTVKTNQQLEQEVSPAFFKAGSKEEIKETPFDSAIDNSPENAAKQFFNNDIKPNIKEPAPATNTTPATNTAESAKGAFSVDEFFK